MSKDESTEEKEAIQDTSEEEKEPTTSQNLFGNDYNLTVEEIENHKSDETNTPEETSEEVKPEPSTEEPPTTKPEPIETKYLSLEEFGNFMIKTKVDGEEQDVSVKDVLRGYQTNKYLTQRGQQIGEQFKQLEKAKDGLIDKSKTVEVKANPEDEYSLDPSPIETGSTEMAQLRQQVEMLNNNLQSVTATLAPTVYEQEMKAINAHLKSQGYDDFMDYRPEIESYFSTLTVEQRVALTEGDVVNKYKDLKIAKMLKTQTDAAVKPVEERIAPTVVNINAGSGRPSGADEDDAKYAKDFARAQETGDWTKVLAGKGYL